jgi:hypothetical protein
MRQVVPPPAPVIPAQAGTQSGQRLKMAAVTQQCSVVIVLELMPDCEY